MSVFGTIHPKTFDLTPAPGLQIAAGPGVRPARSQAPVDTGVAGDEEHRRAAAPASIWHRASFEARFASSFEARREQGAEEVVPAERSAPPASRTLAPETARRDAAAAAVDRRLPERAALTRPPPPASSGKPVRTADADPVSPDADSRTAVYDIAAHAVYLPNGERLEAHSGLGRRRDDPRYVSVKDHGPTPPNVYDLVLRPGLFHGVRAIRLVPVGDGNMFGRDAILAHSYMLGPNGQSMGCVSFRNYPSFLSAVLRGEVNRLVVVERLASAPGAGAGSASLPHARRLKSS